MRYAADFRSVARIALSGRWKTAVITGLIASLLGGVASSGPEINLNISEGSAKVDIGFAGQQIYTPGVGWNEQLTGFLIGGASVVILVALITAVAYVVLGSVVGVGYSKFNLDLVDRRKEPEIGTLFGYFKYWKTTAAASLLRGLFVLLWSLLLVIPGIVAGYSYAMTDYILADHPELTASEAIGQSKQIMSGNRFRLFCLQLSFIGWEFLNLLTLGIGSLWLTPYKQAATAVFYREISGTRAITAGGDDSDNKPQEPMYE